MASGAAYVAGGDSSRVAAGGASDAGTSPGATCGASRGGASGVEAVAGAAATTWVVGGAAAAAAQPDGRAALGRRARCHVPVDRREERATCPAGEAPDRHLGSAFRTCPRLDHRTRLPPGACAPSVARASSPDGQSLTPHAQAARANRASSAVQMADRQADVTPATPRQAAQAATRISVAMMTPDAIGGVHERHPGTIPGDADHHHGRHEERERPADRHHERQEDRSRRPRDVTRRGPESARDRRPAEHDPSRGEPADDLGKEPRPDNHDGRDRGPGDHAEWERKGQVRRQEQLPVGNLDPARDRGDEREPDRHEEQEPGYRDPSHGAARRRVPGVVPRRRGGGDPPGGERDSPAHRAAGGQLDGRAVEGDLRRGRDERPGNDRRERDPEPRGDEGDEPRRRAGGGHGCRSDRVREAHERRQHQHRDHERDQPAAGQECEKGEGPQPRPACREARRRGHRTGPGCRARRIGPRADLPAVELFEHADRRRGHRRGALPVRARGSGSGPRRRRAGEASPGPLRSRRRRSRSRPLAAPPGQARSACSRRRRAP